MNHRSEEEMIDLLVKWVEKRDMVRAMLLTSSRANPRATLDAFSDYDVILVVQDITLYQNDDGWLGEFGSVLTVYHDPVRLEYGCEKFTRVTQYEDGLKIDFTLWPVELLRQVVTELELPPYLDIGYRVLLDKDDLTAGMKPPTHTAFIPKPPTENEYLMRVEHFLSNTSYVAKHLRRGHLMPLKFCLDYAMKLEGMREMFEWKVGITHNWSVRTGSGGGGLEKYLSRELWEEFASTYVGAGKEENWETLFRSIDLFRKVAVEVADQLGFSYPRTLDERVLKYLYDIRDAEK